MTRGEPPGFEPPQMPQDPADRVHRQPTTGADPDEIVIQGRVGPGRTWRRSVGVPVVVAAGISVLVLLAALLVWGPGSPLRSSGGEPTSTPSGGSVPTPPVLPPQFDTFTRQSDDPSPQESPAPDDDLAVATATYTQNGEPSILLIAARPVDDMDHFLLSLGANGITAVGDGVCATVHDVPVCGVVADGIGWAASPLADQDTDELLRIARAAADAAS